jgi:hypothetical protein
MTIQMCSSRLLMSAAVLWTLGLLLVNTATAQGKCEGDPGWLAQTVAPPDKDPHSPNDDCPFYQAAWQHFLFATQRNGQGSPDFFSYKNIADLFGPSPNSLFARKLVNMLSLAPRVAERTHEGSVPGQPRFLGSPVSGPDIFQAGIRGLLIDQNGRAIYYGIHVNDVYSSFISANNLNSVTGLIFAPKDLQFAKSSVELKSAWQVVDDANPPANYIVTKATVPFLKLQGGRLVPQPGDPRTVTVALIALHVVFVLENHPEFIWATFEHTDANGVSDLSPYAKTNPGSDAPVIINGDRNFILFKAGTKPNDANTPIVMDQPSTDPIPFDEATQTFKNPSGSVQTSIFRTFPGSSSSAIEIDDQVQALNVSISGLFHASDVRKNYRLAGAVWLRDSKNFGLDKVFDDTLLQGEDRLSGMAMESFTQDQNCFACHSTKAVKQDLTTRELIPPKLLNVSHVLSKYLADQPPVFADVQAILQHAIDGWTQQNGHTPDLSGHGGTFLWDTKDHLLAATGHGKKLIQDGCGPGKGVSSNLIVDLRKPGPLRMPLQGPFLDEAAIRRIQDWIDGGCSN